MHLHFPSVGHLVHVVTELHHTGVDTEFHHTISFQHVLSEIIQNVFVQYNVQKQVET